MTHFAVALRYTGRPVKWLADSGKRAVDGLGGPFTHALARLLPWLALGICLSAALAVADAALVPESYPTVTAVTWSAVVPIGVTVVLGAVVWTTTA